MRRPLTQVEERRRKSGIPQLWNKRPDGVSFKIPTKTKTGVICLLEFNHMSDVTSHYIVRAKRETEAQYSSLRSALTMTMNRQVWKVEQVNFITGSRSLNEEELKKNLTFFEVVFDITEDPTTGAPRPAQFTEDPTTGTPQPAQVGSPRLLLSTLSQTGILTKLGNTRRERKGERNN